MNLKFEIKDGWIAKDENETVFIYSDKPYKEKWVWNSTGNRVVMTKFFNVELTDDWEDSLYEIKDGIVSKYIEKNKKIGLKIDDLVLVSDDEKYWIPRYFAGWSEMGNGILTWKEGRTSITGNGRTYWTHYKKYEN